MKYSSSQSSRFWYDLKCNVENLKWSSSISVLIGSQMALAAQTLLSQASRVLVSSFSQRLIFLLINTSRFKKKIFLQLFGWHSLNKLSFNCMLNGIKPAIFDTLQKKSPCLLVLVGLLVHLVLGTALAFVKLSLLWRTRSSARQRGLNKR